MLPIGTIIYLKEGAGNWWFKSGTNDRNRWQKQVFDYAACNYPQGLDVENTFYFNEENID